MKALQFNVSIPQFLTLKIFGLVIKSAHTAGQKPSSKFQIPNNIKI